MWLYEKKLEYPVKIKRPNPALAKFIISQVGGPDGEMGAATRYLQQRYSMPYAQVKGMLTDIGTEELAHIEMVSAIIYQLTRCMTPEEIKRSGFDTYFVDHTAGVYPQAASGYPFSTSELQVSGDTLADLYEDLAAEQKARKTYDNILRLADRSRRARPDQVPAGTRSRAFPAVRRRAAHYPGEPRREELLRVQPELR